MSRLVISANHSIKTWKWCVSLAPRCTNMRQLKAIQAIFITHGLHHNNYAISKLLAFCALSDAGSLSSQPQLALHYFHLMLSSDSECPDHHTFPFVLMACANASWVFTGKQIHNRVIQNSLALSDGHVQTALIRFYVECKVLDDAQKVFDGISNLDVIQCNVLISGYLKFGLASEALNVFRSMLLAEIEPDEFCVTTGLTACAHLAALKQGKWIHDYVNKNKGLASDVFVGTALVDMYAKCGCIDMAVEVFERMPERNLFSWAAIIGGFAVHGDARKSINCLERMQVEDGLQPDEVVLLGVLVACNHAGLLKEGQFLLDNTEARYGVVPQHEHYSCVVDLFCRAGQLDEAFQLIRRMPMKPLASVWGAFLSGCRTRNSVNLAELAVKELLLIENGDRAEEDGAYVQLSNIYLAVKKCEDASRIRRLIGDRGLKKTPGCSMIESGKISSRCQSSFLREFSFKVKKLSRRCGLSHIIFMAWRKNC
ncbi:hypothetical protein F0562_005018 [Nyssa sinensis]|uniref:Pentacotripeptide-repeat region of PRORP domain-containing protein n=1 Tax=Nyssa sinensis TaxID=561372 RepID=A0A5J5AJK5_9ASTE|nr:hypothetical protein F0562_005018 [Nyssa sinensis]